MTKVLPGFGPMPTDEELENTPFYFGKKEVRFLPKQFETCFAMEPEIASTGGYGSAKTKGGIFRATRLLTWYPGNKGIIGRYASTDLAATTQADCLEFWTEANLLDDFVEKGKYKIPTATLRCVDPESQEILKGKYSEALFAHVDDPTHLHGHHLGFGWIDEANEAKKKSYEKLMSRLRLPGFERLYSLWVTSNTDQGYDWIYDHFFNHEELEKLEPRARKARRAIHSTTYENRRNLPESYIRNMENSYSEKARRIYLGGSYESFEGQIYEDFQKEVHVFNLAKAFKDGIPPSWNRLLAVDVGGSDPWAWIFAAVDPWGNVIVYDKIYRPGTLVAPFAKEAKPKIGEYRFQAKVIDNENKLAAGELGQHGIRFTNAKKQNKNDSIFRLSGYLHPNPDHAHPEWHPKAGLGNSPRLFIADNCVELIRELPQQRWLKVHGEDGFKNEPDPAISNHAVDALLYLIRELPRPTELEVTFRSTLSPALDAMSVMMHEIRHRAKQENKRREWNARMGSGGRFSGRRHILRGAA